MNEIGEIISQKASKQEIIDSPARHAWNRFRRHKLAMFGLIIIGCILLVAIFAPFLQPYDPFKMDLRSARKAPSKEHLLGTDSVGRDVLSRLISASRISGTRLHRTSRRH